MKDTRSPGRCRMHEEEKKMKYCNKKGTGLTKKQLQEIENIAITTCFEIDWRGGLDKRNNDSEDFPEISIWGLQAMLEEAYKAGLKDAGKKN